MSVNVHKCAYTEVPPSIGWFNAYSVAAHNTSADIFVHLGDYVGVVSSDLHCRLTRATLDLRVPWEWVSNLQVLREKARDVLPRPGPLRAKIGRQTLGRELATIADYRLRLNQYRTDPGLVAAHQKAPWITVW